MRNQDWNNDFDQIDQANVNHFHTNRSGERMYDSGYRNAYGPTSFEQHMQHPSQGRHGVNAHPQRYAQHLGQGHEPLHRQSRADYDERVHLYNRHPQQNATHHGFFERAKEQFEHFVERFGSTNSNEGGLISNGVQHIREAFDRLTRGQYQHQESRYNRDLDRRGQQGNTGQGSSYNQRNNQQRYSQQQGYQNTPYYQGNQGQVQVNRYQDADYSSRSSYRLLDSNSGYGQSGYSYASDRD